jgi:hypothetical protein
MVQVVITRLPPRGTRGFVDFTLNGEPEHMVWEGGAGNLAVGQIRTVKYYEEFHKFLPPDYNPNYVWFILVGGFLLMEIYVFRKIYRGSDS